MIDSSLPSLNHATNEDIIIPPGDIPQGGFKSFFDCVQAYRAAIDAHSNLVEVSKRTGALLRWSSSHKWLSLPVCSSGPHSFPGSVVHASA